MYKEDFENQNEFGEQKPKTFWKGFGIAVISLVLALVTVVVINI